LYLPQSSRTVPKRSPKIFTGPIKKLYIVICRIFELNPLSTLNRRKLPRPGVRELGVDITSQKTRSGIAYSVYISECSINTHSPQAYLKCADHARQTFQTSYWRFSTTSSNTTRHYLNCIITLANNYLRSDHSKERLITTVQGGVDIVTLGDLEDIDFEDTHPDLSPY
jgi:hypothetical protein